MHNKHVMHSQVDIYGVLCVSHIIPARLWMEEGKDNAATFHQTKEQSALTDPAVSF